MSFITKLQNFINKTTDLNNRTIICCCLTSADALPKVCDVQNFLNRVPDMRWRCRQDQMLANFNDIQLKYFISFLNLIIKSIFSLCYLSVIFAENKCRFIHSRRAPLCQQHGFESCCSVQF